MCSTNSVGRRSATVNRKAVYTWDLGNGAVRWACTVCISMGAANVRDRADLGGFRDLARTRISVEFGGVSALDFPETAHRARTARRDRRCPLFASLGT